MKRSYVLTGLALVAGVALVTTAVAGGGLGSGGKGPSAQPAAKGKRGRPGPPGPAGPAGLAGPQGAQGAQGVPGQSGPDAKVRGTGAQSATTGVNTTVNFNGPDDWDAASMHDPSVNPSRMTVPVGGVYEINATISWDATANGIRVIDVIKNGAGLVAEVIEGHPTVATGSVRQLLSDQIRLNANDYIEVTVYQDSGSSILFGGSATTLAISWIGP